MPFLNDLLALLNGSVAIVAYTQCNNPQCPCGRWDSRTNMRNSGGNTLVQPSKRVLEQGRLRRPERFFAVVAHGAFPAPCATTAKERQAEAEPLPARDYGPTMRKVLSLKANLAPALEGPFIIGYCLLGPVAFV